MLLKDEKITFRTKLASIIMIYYLYCSSAKRPQADQYLSSLKHIISL